MIFILDEYDVPLDKAERNGYYRQMLDVVRSMFLSVLKDYPYTEKGILTGCLRISKESLFTGLNNLRVFSVTSDKYCSAFGFTEDEVSRLLHDAGLEDKAETIRKWYDGYSIGSMSIYSPWDVILCVDSLLSNPDAKPENYWANSSGNDAIRRLIDMTDAEVGDDYSTLINGGIIRKKLNETLTYNNLYSSPDNIWSLFLMTGYLTLAGEYDANEDNALRLPNEEIRRLFASSVDEWFSDKVMNSSRKELFDALWSGDATALSEIISQYLFDTISYYDYREDYYHAFLAGLLSGAGYIVKSNRETGTGRADILGSSMEYQWFFTSFTDACFLDALLHVQPQQTSPEASLPSALQISAFQKIHHQRHHDILFLRSGFSNHKRYCNKCPIRYEYLPRRGKKHSILLQEYKEESFPYTLAAVNG